MGRKLMRVPLDFAYPQNQIWAGYVNPYSAVDCNACDGRGYVIRNVRARTECRVCHGEGGFWASPEIKAAAEAWHDVDPPTGAGYQLWETTTEGSPQSPVFATLEDLCDWAAEHATTFSAFKATAAQWRQMLDDDLVYHQEGNVMFI